MISVHPSWLSLNIYEGDKRLRIYFRYDRKLLGKLYRAAGERIRDVYAKEVDGDIGVYATCGDPARRDASILLFFV